jgi:hypothetical protein
VKFVEREAPWPLPDSLHAWLQATFPKLARRPDAAVNYAMNACLKLSNTGKTTLLTGVSLPRGTIIDPGNLSANISFVRQARRSALPRKKSKQLRANPHQRHTSSGRHNHSPGL